MRSEEFDVDGLLNDLDDLRQSCAKEQRKAEPGDPYYKGVMNTVGAVEGLVCKHRRKEQWEQGTLFGILKR